MKFTQKTLWNSLDIVIKCVHRKMYGLEVNQKCTEINIEGRREKRKKKKKNQSHQISVFPSQVSPISCLCSVHFRKTLSSDLNLYEGSSAVNEEILSLGTAVLSCSDSSFRKTCGLLLWPEQQIQPPQLMPLCRGDKKPLHVWKFFSWVGSGTSPFVLSNTELYREQNISMPAASYSVKRHCHWL